MQVLAPDWLCACLPANQPASYWWNEASIHLAALHSIGLPGVIAIYYVCIARLLAVLSWKCVLSQFLLFERKLKVCSKVSEDICCSNKTLLMSSIVEVEVEYFSLS